MSTPRPPKKFHPFPFEYHQEIELTIDSLSNLGQGVARHDGWVVFTPFCLPGERIRARIYRNDKNCSHADLLEVLQPSPDRATPLCPLFTQCGGCQYQHLTYPAQLEWKSRQIRELLQHMAATNFPVQPCHGSPQIWNYRSKITPHFEKPKNQQIGPIGFLKVGRRSELIDVPQCPIAMREINQALPQIREKIHSNATSYKKGATILLRAAKDGIETNPKAPVREQVENTTYSFLAGDFFQNNPFILPEFTNFVAQRATQGGNTHFLVDAYCGSGLFALRLAPHFQQVAGVELSETSAQNATKNAQLNHITNTTFLAANAEAIFAQINFPPAQTAVIIDPPRKGCTPEFLDQLATFAPARVIYVSCDPATQVRDLTIMQSKGFILEQVQPFDLFPHTRHIESIMTFHHQNHPPTT